MTSAGVADRILRRLELTPEGCWEWTGHKRNGYGQIRVDGSTRTTHRLLFEFFIVDVAAELDLDHLCRNRSCANPWHLEPVSRQVNVLRGDLPLVTRERCRALTQCVHGHAYTLENTYRDPKEGRRQCRTCRANKNAAIRRRAKHPEGLPA